MSSWCNTPHHLRPVELRLLHLPSGEVASATLSASADSTAVVWYLDDQLQDAAEFQDREAAIEWAEDVRGGCIAPRSRPRRRRLLLL